MSPAFDDMALPAGKTCGDCRHIRRCKIMFGHVETDTSCDWSPSRFALPRTEPGTEGMTAAFQGSVNP